MADILRVAFTRFAAYDEITSADGPALDKALWAVLAKVTKFPPDSPGTAPPFTPLAGPTPGYRIPPTIGDVLLAANPSTVDGGVKERRGPPVVPIDPKARIHARWEYDTDLTAIARCPRGAIAANPASLAAAIAEVCGPVAGVVLARDGDLADKVADQFANCKVPCKIIRNPGVPLPGRRLDTSAVPVIKPGKWVIIPPGHAAWLDGAIPDPPVIIAADALAACRPRVMSRLFGRPDQRVYAIVPDGHVCSNADLHRMQAAYGTLIPTFDFGPSASQAVQVDETDDLD